MVKSWSLSQSTLHGSVHIPPSKSHTLRAILFGMLGNGRTTIYNPLVSSDSRQMIDACRLFGATIVEAEDTLEIEGLNGRIEKTEDVIQAGNSGIVLRFCSSIGALLELPVVVTGDASIRHLRPMNQLLFALSQLKVKTQSMRGDGYAPIIIQGPIQSGTAHLEGQDSQPVSALLIACAFAKGSVEIHVQNPGELPWVSLTLNWFDRLGIAYENHAFTKYKLFGNASYSGFDYTVPGDFSSAAFLIAAALVTNSELTLHNIDMDDAQGDKQLVSVFERMGACFTIKNELKTLVVHKGHKLSGIEIDVNDFIDGITILAVVGCFATGETRLYNGSIARKKECNRIESIAIELKQLGADIKETEDGLIIKHSALKGAIVHSHHDHRMAMSLAVAAIGAYGVTTIVDVECVSKTYPEFFQEISSLGATIHGA